MESLDALDSRVRTADIVDAMGRLHQHRCHLLDLVSPTPGRRLFGPAVTIAKFSACRSAMPPECYNFTEVSYQAVESRRGARRPLCTGSGTSTLRLGVGAPHDVCTRVTGKHDRPVTSRAPQLALKKETEAVVV
jgi:4-hydroxy-4-methyl-2-oxoglutarate aldolase